MKQVILEYGGAVIAILGAISFFLIFNRFFIGSEGVLGQMLCYSIGEKSLSDNKEFDVYQEKRCPQIVQKEEALIFPNRKISLKKGDILYSEIRPRNRHYAYCYFDADKYIASTRLIVLRAKPEKLTVFFFFDRLFFRRKYSNARK